MPRAPTKGRAGIGDCPKPSPKVFPFAIFPQGCVLLTRRKVTGCWYVGKFLALPKAVMTVIKVCNGTYTTPVDNEEEPDG